MNSREWIGAGVSETYLAFDLGAGSGRALTGRLDARDRVQVEEIHRFPNPTVRLPDGVHWDTLGLFREMLHALARASSDRAAQPASIGVDTWGVDFALLDRSGSLLGPPFAYRDDRTAGAMESFFERMPRKALYDITGIQCLEINTVFQLHAMVQSKAPVLEAAHRLLFTPDLLNYFLTGRQQCEYTIATTSQLLNATDRTWDSRIFQALELPESLMLEITSPGNVLGPLSPSVQAATRAGPIPVVAVAGHDTGSAVAAVPTDSDDFAYVSSGTWSLVGIETRTPCIGDRAREANLTNEGGVDGTYRVLKNVMGLWLLEGCMRAWEDEGIQGYAELLARADAAQPFLALVNPDDPCFLNPQEMPSALSGALSRIGQPVPETKGGMVRCILESLALATRRVLDQLREVSGRKIGCLHIIGGGTRNELLCRFTADATGLEVLAGPAEATAVGNLLMQAMAAGRLGTLSELRSMVRRSFPIKHYEPRDRARWDDVYERFLALVKRDVQGG